MTPRLLNSLEVLPNNNLGQRQVLPQLLLPANQPLAPALVLQLDPTNPKPDLKPMLPLNNQPNNPQLLPLLQPV